MPRSDKQPNDAHGSARRAILGRFVAAWNSEGDDTPRKRCLIATRIACSRWPAGSLPVSFRDAVDSEDVTQSIFRSLVPAAARRSIQRSSGRNDLATINHGSAEQIRAVGAHHRAAKRDIRRSSQVEADHLATVAADGRRTSRGRVTDDDRRAARRLVRIAAADHRAAVGRPRSIGNCRTIARSKRSVERVLQGFRHRLERALQ